MTRHDDLPRDPELQALFQTATDEVRLRHGADDVLQRTRASDATPSSRRGTVLAGLAVAAVVAGIVGIGSTQLSSVTPSPAAPAATESPEPVEATDATAAEDVDATSPLTFFVSGGRRDQGLVSRARPDLDLAGAIVDTIRGAGNPQGSRTAWLAPSSTVMIDVRSTPGGDVIDVDFTRPDDVIRCMAENLLCSGVPLPEEADRRRLALQQVAWTVRAHLGPDTGVRILSDGEPLSAVAALPPSEPDVVYADADAFAPLQIDRPRSGELRNGFVLEGYVSGPSPQVMRWALVRGRVCDVDRRCARSDVDDPFATSPLQRSVPINGTFPGVVDDVTGRGRFTVAVQLTRSVGPGYYELVVEGGGDRRYVPLVVKPRRDR